MTDEMTEKIKDVEIKIFDLQLQFVKLRAMYSTLYQRTYARLVRRSDAEKKANLRAKLLIDRLTRPEAIRMSRIVSQVGKGRVLVTLTKQELDLLRTILKRKRDVIR